MKAAGILHNEPRAAMVIALHLTWKWKPQGNMQLVSRLEPGSRYRIHTYDRSRNIILYGAIPESYGG